MLKKEGCEYKKRGKVQQLWSSLFWTKRREYERRILRRPQKEIEAQVLHYTVLMQTYIFGWKYHYQAKKDVRLYLVKYLE